MNIIIANAPINNANRGCVALSLSTIFLIAGILSERKIKYKFYLPDSGYSQQGPYTCYISNKNIEYYTCNYPIAFSLKGLFRLLVDYKSIKKNFSIFKSADYIMDIGQGDSFSDIYGKQRFESIDKIHRIARLFSKPCCLLSQTIGPFKNQVIKKHAIRSLEKSDLVLVRDKQSYDYVVENALKQRNVHECIDVAFFMPYERKIFSDKYIHVGLNISSLLWHGGYTRNNQFGLRVNYQKLIRSIIDYFLSLNNVKLHLIPHVVGAERHDIENDYAVSYDLFAEYDHENLVMAPLFLDPILAKNYIAGMAFFTGARMHATIAAFSSGVPVYPMAYSRKFNGLFEDTLAYEYMGDMLHLDDTEMLDGVITAYKQRKSLESLIAKKLATVVAERKKMLIINLMNFLQV